MSRTGMAARLRYGFDNSMSRGAIALIGYLGLVSIVLIAFFALVAVANVYMSSFGRLRQEVKTEKLTAKQKEIELEEVQANGGAQEKTA